MFWAETLFLNPLKSLQHHLGREWKKGTGDVFPLKTPGLDPRKKISKAYKLHGHKLLKTPQFVTSLPVTHEGWSFWPMEGTDLRLSSATWYLGGGLGNWGCNADFWIISLLGQPYQNQFLLFFFFFLTLNYFVLALVKIRISGRTHGRQD